MHGITYEGKSEMSFILALVLLSANIIGLILVIDSIFLSEGEELILRCINELEIPTSENVRSLIVEENPSMLSEFRKFIDILQRERIIYYSLIKCSEVNFEDVQMYLVYKIDHLRLLRKKIELFRDFCKGTFL